MDFSPIGNVFVTLFLFYINEGVCWCHKQFWKLTYKFVATHWCPSFRETSVNLFIHTITSWWLSSDIYFCLQLCHQINMLIMHIVCGCCSLVISNQLLTIVSYTLKSILTSGVHDLFAAKPAFVWFYYLRLVKYPPLRSWEATW